MEKKTSVVIEKDSNPDPLTGEPGAHPVGVGAGAVSGGLAGGAIGGAIGGPIGAAVGAVAGGVAGGYAGKAVAEVIDPTVEDRYWRIEFVRRPYFVTGTSYEEYGPAYRYGWESRDKYRKLRKKFEDVESELESGWDRARGKSKLKWEQAKDAVRDAWHRIKD